MNRRRRTGSLPSSCCDRRFYIVFQGVCHHNMEKVRRDPVAGRRLPSLLHLGLQAHRLPPATGTTIHTSQPMRRCGNGRWCRGQVGGGPPAGGGGGRERGTEDPPHRWPLESLRFLAIV